MPTQDYECSIKVAHDWPTALVFHSKNPGETHTQSKSITFSEPTTGYFFMPYLLELSYFTGAKNVLEKKTNKLGHSHHKIIKVRCF